MRLARSGLPVALIVGALILSAPSALAVDGSSDGDSGAAGPATTVDAAGTVRLSPHKAFPGSTVTVSTSACGKETYGKGESEVGASSTSCRVTGRASWWARSRCPRTPPRARTR